MLILKKIIDVSKFWAVRNRLSQQRDEQLKNNLSFNISSTLWKRLLNPFAEDLVEFLQHYDTIRRSAYPDW